VNVPDVGEQPSRCRRTDAGELQQRGAAVGDQPGELLLDGLDLLVDALELDDQLDRKPAPGLADEISRLGRRDEAAGLRREQELLRPSWEQFQQKPMQPVDGLCPRPPSSSRRSTNIPNHHQVVINDHLDKARVSGCIHGSKGNRVRIHRVRLTAVAGR